MAKIYIGCSGFSERLWKGYFYPESLPSAEFLTYYASRVNSVEINSTFYRKPTLKTLNKWYGQVPIDFRFFIKIPKTVTHINRLESSKELVKEFCQHISGGLREKLAGFLFQMPPSFKYTPENLKLLIDAIDKVFLNAVEFRDNSWWKEEIFQILAENNIVFTGVSIPKDIPEDFIVNINTKVYYRLHGNPVMFKSEYSHSYLEQLAEKISHCIGEVYIYFNNTYGIAGIKNALELQKILNLEVSNPTLFDV